MKVIFKAFVLILIFSNALFSQLDNGSIYPQNIEGKDVLTNQNINVQDWLDDGKSVIVSFFASWSTQSWEYYTSGWLNDLNAEFGPTGTDEIRILGIEAESENGPEQLSMVIPGVRPLESQGNWLAESSFPIIDNSDFNAAFSVDLFPITYVIRPDGTMIELNRNQALYNREFHLRSLFPTSRNILLDSNIRDASFCGEHTIPSSNMSILNFGENSIDNFTLEFFIGQSVVQTIEINEIISPLSSFEFETSDQLLFSNSDVTIFVSNINGENYPIDQYNLIEANVIEPLLNTAILKMQITFDKFPEEAQWTLKTDLGTIIDSDSYSPGEVEPYGTVEYEFSIPADVNCLNLELQDSYGDGWTKWGIDDDGNVTPVPGVQFFNQFDVLLKGKHNVENSTNFKVDLEALDLFIKRDAISADNDILVQSDVKLYPSPVVDILKLEGINELTNINSISIMDNVGKNMYNYDFQEVKNGIDVSLLSSGIYYLNILSESGSLTKSFIKE